MKWKVWYRDYRILVRDFREWVALPAGLQGVVEWQDKLSAEGFPLRVLISGTDWYVWDAGHVVSGGGGQPTGDWIDPPAGCSSCVHRSGPTLSDKEWDRIYAEMLEAKWPH